MVPESRARRRPSLLVQIAVALALVGTVPLALAVWQLIGVNRDALYVQLLRTHIVAARTAADALDVWLAGLRSLGASVAGDARFADPTGAEAQALLRDALAGWSESGVAGIVLLDLEGTPAMRVRTRENAAVVDALSGAHPGQPTLAEIDGRAWGVVPVPLASGATLLLVADAAPAAQALAPEELGEQARLVLLERDGSPLWGVGAPGQDDLDAKLRGAALSGNTSGAGRFQLADGPEVVAAWSAADGGRWIVVSTQPGAVAEAAANRMARRAAIAVGASLLLVVAISLAAWRGLVRPLRALLAAQREAAGPAAAAGGTGSETDELHRALVELERRAKERAELDQIFLGRYQVVSHIGSGGMGSVYRGWDPRLQRTVALKTIQLAGEAAGEEGAQKLLAEAVAVAQVAHPNVVAVFDAEQTGGAAFVAMELVDGVGLDKYLEKRGRLDWREVVPLAQALMDGLAAAHARNLVHRDIKPGNVLLGHDGGIKIADFGLATFLHRLHEAPGKVFGTPGFLAPEALQGRPIDERSDLYAAGVVLYRALTGRYPVRGTSFQQIVLATVRDPAPQPFDLELEGCPPAVAELVCSLLVKEPAERLAPASEAARRFAAIAHEHQLVWRLDFGAGSAPEGAPALSAAIPTLRLDADLA